MLLPKIQLRFIGRSPSLGNLQGGFDLGEGSYHVDWLMRDRAERVCSFSWDSEAALPVKDRSINLAIASGEIQRADGEQFKEEPPVQRVSNEPPLSVKVLVNFAPQKHSVELREIPQPDIGPEDVLLEVSKRREWVSRYTICRALITNPKTPVGISVRLMPKLSVRDLKLTARDRNVADAVRSSATRLYTIKQK